MNWAKIRNEYINGYISYRKLAEKHNISHQTLRDRAVKEKWYKKRTEQRIKIQARTEQKTVEKLAEAEANRLLRISAAADRLLEKIEEATEQLDQFIVTNKVRQREVKYITQKACFGKPQKEVIKEAEDKRVVKVDHLDRMGLKQLASALKDLKEIQFVKEEDAMDKGSKGININIRAATPLDVVEDNEE